MGCSKSDRIMSLGMLILASIGLIIGVIFASIKRDEVASKIDLMVSGDCIVTNITVTETICNDDICTISPCKCYYGTINWKLSSNNDTYYETFSWRNTFIPTIGIGRQCWYYDNEITFDNPQTNLNKQKIGIVLLSVFITIVLISTLVVACCVYTDCKDYLIEKVTAPVAINPQIEGQTSV